MLNDLAGRLGVEVRLEKLEDGEGYESHGGLCRIGGRMLVFVDRRQSDLLRCEQLGRALNHLELEGQHMYPVVREFLEQLQNS
jgi:hypothetical protein